MSTEFLSELLQLSKNDADPEVLESLRDSDSAYLEKAGFLPELIPGIVSNNDLELHLCCWGLLLRQFEIWGWGSKHSQQLQSILHQSINLVPNFMGVVVVQLPMDTQGKPVYSKLKYLKFAQLLQKLVLAEERSEEVLEQVCAQLYEKALQQIPGSVRGWYSDVHKSISSAIERYTSLAVSPNILKKEFNDVRNGTHGTLTVKVVERAREVISSLQVEEGNKPIEFSISLPECYPLKPARVDSYSLVKVGIPEAKLRKWMFQIETYLRNLNGSVVCAIQMWKKNVDKELDGYEECLICYSILLASNGSLPTMKCKTCSVNYHPSCLFKWFKQSNKSTCPHCQSPWY
eukprot:TRINITY_DN38341_c0_g1_i6.p1 TRINITY_DN38341_c0_g1~~TRINITY_DN38341_c0_g1_i6.p1  ORF type:complete len:346 (-),score=30.76 TRINITY_DN38341_c0_g1_i6:211-1248(-)